MLTWPDFLLICPNLISADLNWPDFLPIWPEFPEINPAGSGSFDCALDTINPADVLATIHTRATDQLERHTSRSLGLREMMRCASSAARAVSGLDTRDPDREEIVISTLSWPPDPQEHINLCNVFKLTFATLFRWWWKLCFVVPRFRGSHDYSFVITASLGCLSGQKPIPFWSHWSCFFSSDLHCGLNLNISSMSSIADETA